MKNTFRLMTMILGLIAWPSNMCAEMQFSNALAKDIGRAYGFYLGQDYSLDEISRKYPSMSKLALIAEKEFLATFESSIEGMNAIMSKHSETEWNKIKNQLTEQISDFTNIEQITKLQAHQYIELVRQRAKGHIDSPIIETLLLFKSGYEQNPEREFLDGYTFKYVTNGVGKAKGLAFSFESPKTWIAKEGDRPNVIQKFISENGRGLEYLIILIKEIPKQLRAEITETELKDMFGIMSPTDVKYFLPDGSTYLSSGRLTLENLPGFWVHFKMSMSRVRISVGMEAIMYTTLYRNKIIQISGYVATSYNGEELDRGGLEKYEKLFDLMANSFVIMNMYK